MNLFKKNIKKTLLRIIPIFFLTLEFLGIGKILRKLLNLIFIKPKSKLKVTDIDKLSHHLPLPIYFLLTPEIHKSNDWYGNATVLKRYAGLDNDYVIKAAIEHGSSPSRIIFDQDAFCPYPSIITYSKKRALGVERITRKRMYSIGPYIYYAPYLLSKSENIKEKKRLGRNLLVFPAHSSVDIRSDYNLQIFCNQIAKIAKKFDTVRICLYWKDILHGVDKFYRNRGYECVTAGDIFDPLFLSRLKSIIDSATVTISNSIGTHLGYCILFNKPHFLVEQKIKAIGDKDAINEIKDKVDRQSLSAIKKAFGQYTETITKTQKRLISSVWGFDQIKTPGQMKKIFKECEFLYSKNKRKLFFPFFK